MDRYHAILAEWLNTPWALRREVLQAHVRVLAAKVAGGAPAYRAMEDEGPVNGGERISAFEARRRDAQAMAGNGGGIAVLPLHGTIVQRAGMMTEWCGGTSTQQFGAALDAAMADETVGQILIDVDSPGGSVYGVQELGDQIAAARKVKPVVASINSLAASAGYWLAAQAGEVYVTPGGEAGSIGVWMAHEDWSAAMAEQGVKVTLISSGKHKVEGNPYEPLSEDARTFLQGRTDEYYAAFTKAVAKGRGVPIDAVRSGMGQGRVLGAEAALAEKMVDGIKTFAEVVHQMRRNGAKPAGRNALANARNQLALQGG